jgi:4-hydroxyphenylpyruvate dioxygenase
VPPGELDVPAVRGVGGSLLYFVDQRSELSRIWDLEFTPATGAAAQDAGLVSIDHVSQSMDYDEMLSWLLFYTSVFDLERTPEVDVSEPGGLVRSRVVQARDGAVRIALNGALGHRTMSARFLSEFFGSGVQHVAFSTNDIFATAERLVRNGVDLLPIPPNYYDDVAARFGLRSETIERLRTRSILYDRDGSGEYLQIYTPPFAERFFFEIVERRGGYAGFGAPSASIRLTAQQRATTSNTALSV